MTRTTHPPLAQLQHIAALPITAGLGHAQQRVEINAQAVKRPDPAQAQRQRAKTALAHDLADIAKAVQAQAAAKLDKVETALLDVTKGEPVPLGLIAQDMGMGAGGFVFKQPQPVHARGGLLSYDAITDTTYRQEANGDWVQVPNDLAQDAKPDKPEMRTWRDYAASLNVPDAPLYVVRPNQAPALRRWLDRP